MQALAQSLILLVSTKSSVSNSSSFLGCLPYGDGDSEKKQKHNAGHIVGCSGRLQLQADRRALILTLASNQVN